MVWLLIIAAVCGLSLLYALRRVTEPAPTRFKDGERVWLRSGGDGLIAATVLSRHWSPKRGYAVEFYSGVEVCRRFLHPRRAHKELMHRRNG
jgi:hypothetical protein